MTTVKPDRKQSETGAKVLGTRSKKPSYDIELWVGVFVIVAMILLLYGWTWLKSFSILHPPQLITVQFHDIAGLANNAPVNINGVRVGTVDRIDLKGKGQVLVHLRIKTEEVKVPQGSHFTIQTLGLVGAKYIEISLPEEKPGEEPLPIIENDTVVIGHDPVRLELIANKIASNVNEMISRVSDDETQSSFASALQNSGKTIENINQAASKLNNNMDKVIGAAESISKTSAKFAEVADRAKNATASADSFFSKGSGAFSNVSGLSTELTTTSKKVNKILDNPGTVTELRETAKAARQLMSELNTTLKDKSLREDMKGMLGQISKSTENISHSMEAAQKIADDKGLRSDLAAVVRDAKESIEKVDKIISGPTFKTDLKTTMHKMESAATTIDVAAKQLSNILDKKSPLLHVMFGRPGNVEEARKELEKEMKEEKNKNNGGSTAREETTESQRIKLDD